MWAGVSVSIIGFNVEPLNKKWILHVTKTDNAKEDKAYRQAQCTIMEYINLIDHWPK
jgi:hypothetical protein